MFRLGLQLIVKGGREALVRLLLTTMAVAVGVAVLLAVLADFNAYQKTSDRPSWESSAGVDVAVATAAGGNGPNGLLWNYSENIYKGQFIEQLDVAAEGSHPPLLPGIAKTPGPGQYYASPALANLLKTVPADQLGNRFPGRMVGTIGEAALSFPTELAIYDGVAPNQLAALPGTMYVTHIATAAQLQGTTNIYREAFGIGALAILFPLLILINTATRLAAARREERFAAMRLVGATPRQINALASVDALVGALLGALLGSLIFLALRHAVADVSFSGVKFFPNYVTPTLWGYLGMIVIVPIIATLASLLSLRRVQISPLGVSRRATPKKPRAWGLIPLVLGLIMFPYAASTTTSNGNGGSPGILFGGFLLILVGIVLSGSWLTMLITGVLAKFAGNAPSLLAARRLSDNPKAAFRTISGLVLGVFIGSVVAVLVPALNYAQSPTGKTSMNSVLRVLYASGPLSGGLPPQDGSALVSKIESYPGAAVIPIYSNPAFISFQQQQMRLQSKSNGNGQISTLIQPGQNSQPPDDSVINCVSLAQLSVLGRCPADARAVTFTSDNILQGDNPLFIYKSLPMITPADAPTSLNTRDLSLEGLLIKPANANQLEQIRTYLTVYNGGTAQAGAKGGADSLTAWQMGELEPETVGEVAQIRNNDDTNVGRAVLAVIVLTLITAGCSLAVTIGGSLVERKRAFTLLRVSGVPLSSLRLVILLEAALPLLVISAIAAGLGLGVGIPVVKSLLGNFEPKNLTVPVHPSSGYYLTLGIGLVVALCLVLVTLPLLGRLTKPEEARFE